ncbi:hypothetical protein [Sphingobium sp.]|uniref:hypothetical protein n=1 Tax=Sphingobium sp. TaxID=1912891 RepID=UPI000262B750
MRKVTMIDPPHGWRYGFPKPLTLGEGQSLQDWLIENGYPPAEINVFGIAHMPCRGRIRAPLTVEALLHSVRLLCVGLYSKSVTFQVSTPPSVLICLRSEERIGTISPADAKDRYRTNRLAYLPSR